MSNATFLRRVLALDAATCIGTGALLALAAAPLAGLFGLPHALVSGAGIALLPIGLFMAFLATRAQPPRLLVWAVIVGNAVWAVESFIVIGQFGPTTLGAAFVAAQALVVAALAALEYVGLKRMAAAPARA